jgi:hypothetical protein
MAQPVDAVGLENWREFSDTITESLVGHPDG